MEIYAFFGALQAGRCFVQKTRYDGLLDRQHVCKCFVREHRGFYVDAWQNH